MRSEISMAREEENEEWKLRKEENDGNEDKKSGEFIEWKKRNISDQRESAVEWWE